MRTNRNTLLLAAGGAAAAATLVRRRRAATPEQEGDLRRRSWLARLLDPTRGPVDAPPEPPALPPASLVTVPGRGELFVRRAGRETEGVPVLLLHGWMASADLNWFRVYDALAPHHQVLALDHRGHGRGLRAPQRFTLEDCADDAAALLRHLGVGPVVAVGYSMGGPIATLLWRRHPDLVAGIVYEAAALEWKASAEERMRWRTMSLVSMLLRYEAGRLLLFRLTGGGEEPPEDLMPLRPWMEGEFRRGDWPDLAEAGRAIGRYDARPLVSEIDVPVASVVTTRDRLVPPEKQYDLARATGARLFEFPGDHDAAVAGGDRFARLTLDAVAAVAAVARRGSPAGDLRG